MLLKRDSWSLDANPGEAISDDAGNIHTSASMARNSSLLVAIALAAAPHTAHALGKTDLCD